MKLNDVVRTGAPLAAAAALLMLLSGCVLAIGTGDNSEPETYTAGEWIQKQARASNQERALAYRVAEAIANDPLLNEADIEFRINGDIVTLSGTVYSLATYRHAIETVHSVEGVETVTSRIELNVTQ
ncbi:MAG TPA: BON domain-containing protein [Gammaproteobacteria bacterium]|nr:BON domain-containing protein [Gammaproteobacteria bacterium]